MSNFQCHCSSKLYRKYNFQVLKLNVNFVIPPAGHKPQSGGTFYPTPLGDAAHELMDDVRVAQLV